MRLERGQVLACYEVLEMVRDARSSEHRRYRVKALCCGTEYERAEHTLKSAHRRGYGGCPSCSTRAAQYARSEKKFGYMERCGPVRVLARGSELGLWRVVWDCCDRESELTTKYLQMMRKAQNVESVCRACAIERSRVEAAARRVLGARVRPPRTKFVAPPRVTTGRAVRTPKPEAPPKAPVYHSGGGPLPEGVIAAGNAWPIPGRRVK